MTKYLVQAVYSPDGFRGLLKETANGRKAAISKTYEALGGKVECFYLSAENGGIVMIVDLPPDAATGAGFTVLVQASGAFADMKITPLFTVDEVDQGLKKSVNWHPPGG